MLPSLQDVGNASVNIEELFVEVSQNLQELSTSFGHYFPDNALERGTF